MFRKKASTVLYAARTVGSVALLLEYYCYCYYYNITILEWNFVEILLKENFENYFVL